MADITILLALVVALIITAKVIDNQTKEQKRIFDAKVEVAQAQALSKDIETFEQLRENINYIISFYVAHEIIFVQDSMKEVTINRELLVEQLVSSVCAKTLSNLSNEQKRQFSKYATIPRSVSSPEDEEDFLTYFIRKETLSKVITAIDNKLGRPIQK